MPESEGIDISKAKRLHELRKRLKLSQVDFSARIGSDQANVSKMEKGTRLIGKNIEFKILTIFNVNEDWWYRGEGNPFKRKEVKEGASLDPEDVEEVFITKNGNRHLFTKDGSIIMEVPFVNRPAYAGYPQIFDDPVKVEESLPTIPLPVEKVHRGEYRCFEVLGDSMSGGVEEPQIKEGEIVVCRRLARHLWDSPLNLKRRKIWVIVLKNDILIKNIIKHDVTTHTITIHSFNENKDVYPDEDISLNDVYELYYVLRKISEL